MYGNLVDASDTSHVSALFERVIAKLLLLTTVQTIKMYLNATLQPGKRHMVKLTPLKVHGEYAHFATPSSRVMLSSASHQGLKVACYKRLQ